MSKVAMLNRMLRPRGLTLVPDWRMDSLPLAAHLRKVFDVHRITCALDVGANLGQYREFLRDEVGWNGPVVSFEPVKRYFDRLAPNDTWRVFNYALGNENAQREITVFDSPGLASVRTADLEAMDRLLPRGNVHVEARETIQIRRLSDVFSEVTAGFDVSRVYLKMDTQGFDLEVFRGAKGALPSVVALQTEVSFLPIYKEMPHFTESIAEIHDAGFDVSAFFPVTLDPRLRAIEFDCVFVKRA